MPLTACTIQEVLSTDNPNEGRVKINSNFECLESSIYNLQVEANTGSTVILASTNINTSLFYSGITPIYSISVVNDPIFNSLSASSMSADTYYIGSTPLQLYLSGNSVFTSGSSGNYYIRANNDSANSAVGNYSYSEGYGTTAIGNNSHAEGNDTTAVGSNSHAEGNDTKAIGDNSHAEGNLTKSIGVASHAEGNATTASGSSSHAEGAYTTSGGEASHAEGVFTTAIGDYSHAEGYNTSSFGNNSHAEGQGAKATGGASHAEGEDTNAIGNTSHAEGYTTTSIGVRGSHAEGQFTIASGISSHAEGSQTTAVGFASHAEGNDTKAIGDNSHAEGYQTTAFGDYSHAEGSGTIASGYSSHAEGYESKAMAAYSHAGGYKTYALNFDKITPYYIGGVGYSAATQTVFVEGDYSSLNIGTLLLYSNTQGTYVEAVFGSVTYNASENYSSFVLDTDYNSGGDDSFYNDFIAFLTGGLTNSLLANYTEGNRTVSNGYASHAEGNVTIANGNYSHAEGSGSFASGDTSHAEGSSSTAIGQYAHAQNLQTTATGIASHSEGSTTLALGNYSHAEGQSTIALGENSHAEGLSTISSGNNSHAEGRLTTAIGQYSHSEGQGTISIGWRSHAEGYETTSEGGSSHAQGFQTIAVGENSHAGGYVSTASGITSFVHSTNSLVTGDRSVVLGGQNITGATNDTVYVPYLNILNISSGTPITSLAVDSNGMVVSGASIADLGNVLFVSENGNDNSGQKGNINKPWRNIYSAKSASTSGDTIYILPGTWTYDNRNSEGNPYNGQIETKVNLWKNGVTYYFMPGAKIKFYNQTVSGQIMYLFNPANVSGETCTVLGSLDWEGYSTGADSFNGHTAFFWADSSNDSGFTFSAEVKKLSSFGSEIYRLNRLVTFSSDTVVANFRLDADELYHQYVGGQSGGGATEFISGSDAVLNAYINVRERTKTTVYHMFQITGDFTRSNINFFGDKLIHSGNYTSIFLRSFTGVVNMNIKNMYWYGTFIQTQVSGGGIFNLTGNLSDYYINSSGTGGVMYLTTANNTINLKGNITTNTGSVVGRYVVATTQPNTINIDGDIQFLGSATTTQAIFQTINRATVNYSGKILGTYGGPIAQTYTGTININNSFIQSGVDSSSAQIFQNGGSSSGTCRINNSYIEMRNNSNPLANGSYVKALLNNSTIINTGTGTTLSNTTNFGSLQLINSTIMTSGLTSVGYSSTGTPVVSSNSVANTNYNIASVYGTFNVINELTY